MKYHFITAIWGAQFTDLLLRVMLPNQFSAGNLGYFTDLPESRYRIYTTEEDASRISHSREFAKLKSILPTELITVPGLGEQTGHDAAYADMTRCHRMAIAEAEAQGAAMIFLPGDAIWSDGSFRRLAELSQAGYTAVLVAGIRLILETYADAFLERFVNVETMEANVGARDLFAHALPYLHPLTKAYFVDAANFIRFPSHVIWPVQGRGLILKAFHLHPALVKPAVIGGDVSTTIDHNYLTKACPDPDRIYVVEDSDEILQVAVDTEDHRKDLLTTSRFNLTRFVEFSRQHTEEFQRQTFIHKLIRIHTDDLGSEWNDAITRAKSLGERFHFAMNA